MPHSLSLPNLNFQTFSPQDETGTSPQDIANVELIELHDEPTSGGILPSLLSVYQDRGYERGYRQAVADISGSLFSETEDFVRMNAGSAAGTHADSVNELRRVLYLFGQQVERRLQALKPDPGFVSDGLGI